MIRKIGLLLSCCVAVIVLAGCVGYAGQVNAAGKGGSTSYIGVVSASPAAVNLGSVVVGSSAAQSFTVTNSGNATVVVSSLSSTNSAFAPTTSSAMPFYLSPGQSFAVSVAFNPSAAGSASGTLTVVSNASNAPTYVSASGTGTGSGSNSGSGSSGSGSSGSGSSSGPGVMSASPAALSMGSVAVGSAGAGTVTVSNSGGAAVTISSLSSTNGVFSATTSSAMPFYVMPGQSFPVNVAFKPSAAGSATGTITVGSNASDAPTYFAVTGTGTGSSSGSGSSGSGSSGSGSSGSGSSSGPGVMSASPAALSMGSVAAGSAGAGTVTVSNSGGAAVTISSLSSTNGVFSATTSSAMPFYVMPGQSFAVNVAFKPSAAGSSTGTITVGSNASNAPTYFAVTGTGTGSSSGSSGSGSSGSGSSSGPGVVGASPAALSIGSVAVGSAGSGTVTVSNSGGAAVTISSLTSTNAAFAATTSTAMPFYLMPGQSFAMNVAFQPSAAGNASGTVTVVSNASNAPTTVAVTGTGTSGSGSSGSGTTYLLNSSTSSLSFGSVNVGANSAQPVTFTNGGTGNVTISSVSISGSGYTASGVTSGQVLTPGQTASLNVTFTPGSAASLSGSVSVVSNATNSPASVSLSGTGTQQSASSGSGSGSSGGTGPGTTPPICGTNNDMTVHIPTDWSTFTPPAKGQSYVDPTFGCTVTRVTDVSSEIYSGSYYVPIMQGYATVSPFNSNDTYLMLTDGWNRHFVTDLQGNILVSATTMPNCSNSGTCTTYNSSNDGWFYWDATNPAVFYYTTGNYMMEGTISGSNVTSTVIHQFTEYTLINFMDKTDLSEDGAHVALVGGDATGSSPINVFDYDFVTNSKGPVYTTGCTASIAAPNNDCIHGVTQTADNDVMIDFANDGTGAEQGDRLWTGVMPLPHVQDATNHIDTGYDMNGNSIFVGLGNSSVLSTETSPCPSGWGMDVRQVHNVDSAVCLTDFDLNDMIAPWHVGYRGNAQQPWVGLSFFDDRSTSPEWFDNTSTYTAPSSSNWMLFEDEIVVARIDANNNPNYVYRLARAYSRSDEEFYSQPHAAISRDGHYLAFDSNMAYAHTGCPANFQTTTGCEDVYVIKIH